MSLAAWLSKLVRPRRLRLSTRVHDFALEAYKKTNGPTPELRRVYEAYKANQAKRTHL